MHAPFNEAAGVRAVCLALCRLNAFVVAAMFIAILGLVIILKMPTDIFPNVNIPVIAVSFNLCAICG